ncbi:hypothetical protein KP509_17G065500 [Ceratopteris richardii]|nr:hypothetical protein KP509_17G065500 [Ceratopteris richardii]
MDSDDDFGDFTFAPAGTSRMTVTASANSFRVEFPTASDHDLGISFDPFGFQTLSNDAKTSTAQAVQVSDIFAVMDTPSDNQNTFSMKPIENNSDDDWGDFVEHSASSIPNDSNMFDWFGSTSDLQSSSQVLQSHHSTNGNASVSLLADSDWKDGFRASFSEQVARNTEQKSESFMFGDLYISAEKDFLSSKGNTVSPSPVENGVVNDSVVGLQEIAQQSSKTTSDQKRNGLNEFKSSPIPLSSFGDSELETENSNAELVDSLKTMFEASSRHKNATTNVTSSRSSDLSSLIANLYTEAESHSSAKNQTDMDTLISTGIGKTKNSIPHNGYSIDTATNNSNLEKSMFSLSLGAENGLSRSSSKCDIMEATPSEVQSKVSISSLLDSVSTTDRQTYVQTWASILAICASELELASDIWKQAEGADIHLDLIADPGGKTYFAAIGQVYIVALILAVTLNLYKPWLEVAEKEAENVLTDLKRCQTVWLDTNLKAGVRLALSELQGSIPTSVVSWQGIELFATVALEAYIEAASTSVQYICKISLLPIAPFSCLHSTEWCGSTYLLPVANLWANCISQRPPAACLSG